MNENVDFDSMCRQMESLSQGVSSWITNLANAAALIYETVPKLNWAGFYYREENALLLGPFQGKPACTRIGMGRGVCGSAAQEDKVQAVADVHCFPGHIACDSASASELVIPIHSRGRVWGVLDLDSPETGRFSKREQEGFIKFCRIIEDILINC